MMHSVRTPAGNPGTATGYFPGDGDQARLNRARRLASRLWRRLIQMSTVCGLLVLSTLLYNVVNSTFGYVVARDSFSPDLLVLLQRGHVQLAGTRDEAIQWVRQDPHRMVLMSSRLLPQAPSGTAIFGVPIPGHDQAHVLAAAVAQDNSFLRAVGPGDLETALAADASWPDLDASFPAAPIEIAVVQDDEGLLDAWVRTLDLPALSSLSKEQLVSTLEQHLSAGLMRRYAREEPFAQRSHANVLALVEERVVDPRIVTTFSLRDSIFRRADIMAYAHEHLAEAHFQSWLTGKFLVSPQSSHPQRTGIRTAILGTLWVIAVTICFAVPLGIGAAIYLEEYSSRNWFERIIETNINNLAGVPSIIYGMLGLVIFVRALNQFSSGAIFGVVDAAEPNGRTIIAAGLTLGLLILPVIIISGQEAIRAVPLSLREAAYGVGATKWQTVRHHVLPMATPGILTGAILAISRAMGETAPLVVIGAATFISVDPNGLFAKFTVLPIQIYQWTSRPQTEFRNIAAAAILIMLALLLAVNATAVLLRQRYSRNRL